MAEAAAVVGLISSIITLVDLGAKIVSRICDFTTKSSEVPKSFRALADRLPLLIQTLGRIQVRARAGHVSNDLASNLKTLVDSINVQIELLEKCLAEITPPANASRLARGVKALQSLTKDEQVTQAVEKVHGGIDVLVLHQTTTNIDLSDRILQELASMKLNLSPVEQTFGLWLDQAPQADPDAFLGRTSELQQLDDWLSPRSNTQSQRVVSIVGMGGLGKTQLSLAYTRQHGSQYSSVFWINAKDKLSLQQSMLTLSQTIFVNDEVGLSDTSDDELRIQRLRKWLSEPWNDRWLIIFDNYDDPALPNVRSSTGFDVRSFFPSRAQGSILITTRSPKLMFSRRLVLQKLDDITLEVAILSQRAGRDLSHESSAQHLARRLDGLPLALATAGTYIGQTGSSCADYLDMYEQLWSELHGPESEALLEYADRTLASTWMISLDHVSRQDIDAVELFKFFALLNNEDIWYKLLQGGAADGPPWMDRVTSTKIRFDRAMVKLRDYSLVEVVPGSYRVHPCVHDWLLGYFQLAPDKSWFLAALRCVVGSMLDEMSPEYWAVSRRLAHHIQRLDHKQFRHLWKAYSSEQITLEASHKFAGLYQALNQFKEAEQMYTQALRGKEKALGPEHGSTLATLNNLAIIYTNQGRLAEAEQVYTRALAGKEKVLGPEHKSTLATVGNLGLLFIEQGRLAEAEQMYTRALVGMEKIFGTNHTSTLRAVNNLGILYFNQSKLVEAEQMYTRALSGLEKVLGPDHTLTLGTVNNLSLLYAEQSKLAEAEQSCTRALAGYEKVLGPEHTSTLDAVYNLGLLYAEGDRLAEAEQLYARALAGFEKVLGPEHTSTLKTLYNLGRVYHK